MASESAPNEMVKSLGDHGEGWELHHTIMPYHRWPMQLSMADQHRRLACEFRTKVSAYAVTVTGSDPLFKLWKCRKRIGDRPKQWDGNKCHGGH